MSPRATRDARTDARPWRLSLSALLLAGCGLDAIPDKLDPGDDPGQPVAGGDWTCEATGTHGPRQIRLLTRTEYRNTLRDLLADPGAGDTAPCGEVTFSLPDAGYASVTVAGSFNGWDAAAWPLSYDAASDAWTRTEVLGEGSFQYKFVADGAWIADPANPDRVDDGYGGSNSVLTLSCDGDTGTGGLSAADLDALLTELVSALPPESRPQGFPFDNAAAAGLVSATHADAQLLAAEAISDVLTADLDAFTRAQSGCAHADAGCDAAFVAAFGARAWRRPLTPAQSDRLLALLRAEADPAEGWRLAIQAILASPYLLYRTEIGVDQGDGTWRIQGYELASALSYLYWESMPDAELYAAAADGSLDTPEGLRAQAARLLDDPRARDRLARFAQQWLGAEPILTVGKADDLPADVRAAMLDEAGSFVADAALSGAAYPDLLAPLYTTDAPPAAIEAWYGTEARYGLIGLGAVLATTAHSDQTSPIRRGLFVRERLLCQEFGAPPANAGGVPDVDPDATTRERFAAHTADPNCAACHRYIDPIGFGFEHFDPLGRWREDDNGLPIDASGEITGIGALGNPDALAFTDLSPLADALAGSDRAPACYTVQVMRAALGWQPADSYPADEVCAYDPIRLEFQASGYDLRALLIAAVLSDPFLIREDSP